METKNDIIKTVPTDAPPAYTPYSITEKGEKNKDKLQTDEEDPWKIALPELSDGPTFWELDTFSQITKVSWILGRIVILLITMYLFVCSLSFLSSAFRLIGGFTAGSILSRHSLLTNPVAGLMVGVLVTVLVQSSSTSTSIIVAMVGAGLVEVHVAIPVIMGANIGTSVTNTIVALGQAKEKNEFRRAFGGATVHDMFNWLSVIVLLPVEVITGYLEWISGILVQPVKSGNDVEVEILKAITDPFTKWVIQIDKDVIKKVAEGKIDPNTTARILKVCEEGKENCKYHWFWKTGMSDTGAGIIVLIASVLLLLVCLIVIVKILHSLLKGSIARIVHKVVNAEFPGRAAYFTGYLAIFAGAICTFIVQSSSIFTSAITPLVGIGVISLERMYPLTLGANIGTTATGILAALSVQEGKLKDALQLAFCHLIFNITGILIWYPIPYIRFPIPMARRLGDTTAEYRWFAVAYLILAFFLLPAIVFGLSAANESGLVLMAVGIPVLVLLIIIIIINFMQHKFPNLIENSFMRDWEWLPLPLHSLRPWHNLFTKMCICCNRNEDDDDVINEGHYNPAFQA